MSLSFETRLGIAESNVRQAQLLVNGDRQTLRSRETQLEKDIAAGQALGTGLPLTDAAIQQRRQIIEKIKQDLAESEKALERAKTEYDDLRTQAPPGGDRDSAASDINSKQPELVTNTVVEPANASTELTDDEEQNLLAAESAFLPEDSADSGLDFSEPVNTREFYSGPSDESPSSGDSQGEYTGEDDPDFSVSPGVIASNSVNSKDQVTSGAQGSPEKKKVIIPSNNILHDYVNYTYLLSWHLMSIDDYNNLMTNPESRYIPKNVLVSSAGKYNNEFVRSPAWKEDFYFESLDLQTVVGLNSRSRGTNAIDISFRLIEPYGASLLERLLRAADSREISVPGTKSKPTTATAKNYTQLPYMLQIDFAGYTDTGEMILIKDATKYIPINVLTIEFKVSNRGSEYTIKAVPFNHQAFKSSQATVPANFEISTSTVREFFKGTGIRQTDEFIKNRTESLERRDTAVKIYKEAEKNIREEGEYDFDQVKDLYYQAIVNAEKTLSNYAVDGLESALNDYYLFEKTRKSGNSITVAPEFYFEIDEEIAKAKIITVEKTDPKDSPINSSAGGRTSPDRDYQNSQKTKKQDPAPGIPYDPKTRLHRLNAGTNIVETINYIIRNSSYVLDQIDSAQNSDKKVTEREAADQKQDKTKPINWFKIVPRVEIIDYDTKLNSYALKVTYEIKKHPIYGRTIPNISQARVPADRISKIYNYIYTGTNQDILDLNIEFNTQYFMAITSSPDKFFSTSAASADENVPNPTEERADDPNFIVKTGIVSSNQKQSYSQTSDPRAVAAADVAENLMNSGADMISVKLKIIGDPAWIKQDDIFNTTERQRLIEQEATRASSIPTDDAEVYVRLNFRVPTDINTETGLYNFDKMQYGVFSGIYRVLTVSNKFEKGQFTQDLDLVRILNQPAANTTKKSPPRENQPSKEINNEKSVLSRAALGVPGSEYDPGDEGNGDDGFPGDDGDDDGFPGDDGGDDGFPSDEDLAFGTDVEPVTFDDELIQLPVDVAEQDIEQ
jgi:hypothetical protein